MDLLRLSTVGSVDDGKSTLIGRLLFDSRGIFEDQLLAVERASLRRGQALNLALLTDGLRAEREQGITIDVAYRYFATPRRKFIIADTPGHVEFTRNMVTGASTADVAVVLVDVTRGVVEQSRRHATIASLLGVPRLIICVNKMDLVGFERAPFERVRAEFGRFVAGLAASDVAYLPISALHGDNVVTRSARLPWYEGPALLELLERVPTSHEDPFGEVRMAIQYVVSVPGGPRPFRGYAGRLDGGVLAPGDFVTSMATGRRARIAAIHASGQVVEAAIPPMSVLLEFDTDPDLERGDVLAAGRLPTVAHHLEATVCWMVDQQLRAGSTWSIKHGTRTVTATCAGIRHRVDVNSLAEVSCIAALELNEIGRIALRLDDPLFVDDYEASRATGSFIMIDRATADTVAAGMIETAR